MIMGRNKNWFAAGELTEKERELFKEIGGCRHACERLTREALKHYEQSYIMEQEALEQISKRLGIDLKQKAINVNWRTGEVMQGDYGRISGESLLDQMWHNADVKRYVRDRLNEDDETRSAVES